MEFIDTILACLDFNLDKGEVNLPIQVLCKFITDISLSDKISCTLILFKAIDCPRHPLTTE